MFWNLSFLLVLPSLPPVMDKERETGTGRSKKKKKCMLLKRARVCLCGIVLLEIYIKNLHNITRDSEIDLLKYSTFLYENINRIST